MLISKFFSILFISILVTAGASAAEWPSWRGADQNGYSPETGLISQWSATGENLVWKADFIGRSTPVVMNGRVYVIGRTGSGITMQEHIACFDAENGKKLWEKKFNVYHSTVPFTRVGWASLVGDPETGHVYAHGVGGLMICLDRDGKVVWLHSLTEEFGHISGFGGRTDTPIVDESLVILGFVNSSWGEQAPVRHRFFAFDKRTGDVVWVSTPGGMPYDFNIYSTPVVSVVNRQRLLIGGNGDGSIYALKVRTGEKVWGFQLSKRGINAAVVVNGDKVYAGHSEENIDEATMGRVVCINAVGTGDITKTNEVWRYDRLEVGYTAPLIHNGRLYVVDNSGNLYSFDAADGKLHWKHNLGTVGKGSPVWADGKIYATEVNGTFAILKPEEQKATNLDVERLMVGGKRHAEIYGSPAIAYGRIYFTTEEGLYCLGNKNAKLKMASSKAAIPEKKTKNTTPAAIQVVPAEVLLSPGEKATFKIRSFDAQGEFIKETSGTWTVTGLEGQVQNDGTYTAGNSSRAGVITAETGGLKSAARARVISNLPIVQDFQQIELEKSPPYWIGSTGKFFVREKDGNKVLVKTVQERGLQTADVYMGPATWKGYTVQVDLMGTKVKRRMPDMGVIASGYTLDLMGGHQRLQLRSWASELRINKTIDFPWNPDVWYTMKFQVDVQGDKGIIRGKVWPTAEKEPDAWTVEAEDPIPIREGSPGIYGNSLTEIYYDNLKITKSEL